MQFLRAVRPRRGCQVGNGNPKLLSQQKRNCTDIFVVAQDGSPVHARSMEFGKIGQLMSVQPKNNNFDGGSPMTGVPGLQYTNNYGYFCMNVAVEKGGREFKTSCDGANEKGLSVGGLYFPGYAGFQEVPSKSDAARAVCNLNMCDYLLGNFASVDEVRNAVPDIIVWDPVSSEEYGAELEEWLGKGVPAAAYHWVVYDESGSGIVIEYMNGELALHDAIGVFTNSPNYDWHVTNTTRYDALQAQNPPDIDFGQGYGLMGAPGDFTPPSRFIRAYLQRKLMVAPKTSDEAVNALSHVMNTVDMVNGIAKGGISSDITNWLIIKDLAKSKMYYRIYDGLNWGCVDMDFKKLSAMEGQNRWDVVLPTNHELLQVDAFSKKILKKSG